MPSVSFDGTRVAFLSSVRNLNPNSTSTNLEVVLKNLVNGNAQRVATAAFDADPDADAAVVAISNDGLSVAFDASATKTNNRLNGDNGVYRDYFVYNSNNNSYDSPTSVPTGTLNFTHVTFAFNDGVVGATGNVVTANSLYAGTVVQESVSKFGKSLGSNLYDTPIAGPFKTALSDKLDVNARNGLSLLTTFANGTSGYPLKIGSQAINGGNASLSGTTVDQRNVTRQAPPDIGAFEAVDATVSGTLFVDLDAVAH